MFLLRPVMQGLITYPNLKDSSIDLFDIWLMNEAIKVDNENQFRMSKSKSNRG